MWADKLVLAIYIVAILILIGFPLQVLAKSTKMPDTTLWLEVVVNGKSSGQVLPIEFRADHYWLTAEQLANLGLSMLNPKQNQTLAIDSIEQVNVDYNSELQQLLVDLPSSWLPAQYISQRDSKELVKSDSSTGVLVNYDLYATSTEQSQVADTASLWSEQRLFSPYGIVSNTGIYRNTFNGKAESNQANNYMRYDTQWYYSDESRLTRYAMGDVISDSLSWSSSVRLGGFQFARNFSIRPDLVTYPLPQFAGQAAIPSTVDLYVNSYKVSSANLDPGPFTLDTQPSITGAGNATVVTTDALGRKVSTTVPFYVANSLLASGLTDYSVTAGFVRQAYATQSFKYGDMAASAVIRHGLSDKLTLEGRADTAADLWSSGVGAGWSFFNWGVVNLAWSHSQVNDKAWSKEVRQSNYNQSTGDGIDKQLATATPSSDEGQQVALGYNYTNSRWSIALQRLIRSKGYADLATYKSNYRLSRRQDQATASVGLDKLGNLGAGYFEIKDALGGRTRLANLSWSVSLWGNSSLYTSINKEIGGKGYSAQFTFTMPLGDWGTSNITTSRDVDNHWVTRASWSRSAPMKGGLGWNFAAAQGGRDGDKYRQADVTWRSSYAEGRAGIYGRTDEYTRWGELTGSLVAMEGGLYAANTINDAFALVSTSGFADIPVSYENKYIGNTNQQGYLLVPYITAWYNTKLDIDPINLPADVKAPAVDKQVSIREGSGLLVDFNLKQITAVSFSLVDSVGQPIVKGSVIEQDGKAISWVGWDGQVWLEDVNKNWQLTVIKADDGKSCHLQLNLSNKQGIVYLEQQVCR